VATPRNPLLRQLPKIDEILGWPELEANLAPRWAVREAARRVVADRRRALLQGETESPGVTAAEVLEAVAELVRPSLRRVINGTGVILHTNLGRAPLSRESTERVMEVAAHYSNLEYDLAGRARGSRHDHLVGLITSLTGAADAAVVNNNAAAVLIALAVLAEGRQVVVSRGELIEIGGSFRIPDVMRLSGARLIEVGTTNKTHRRDYEHAITGETALLLKVHRSNFALVGFTAEVELGELVELARARGVASMIDLGSGALLERAELGGLGLAGEPAVGPVVATGVDVATFSGDKLLGGPQAGILVGAAEVIDRVRRHPLMRAVRPDKLTLAALEATLAHYRDGRAEDLPAVAMLRCPEEQLRTRAEQLLHAIGEPVRGLTAAIAPCRSAVGGGALPTAELPSWAVALSGTGELSAAAIDARLRAAPIPVIARIAEGAVIIDVRTIAAEELAAVAATIRTLGA
jgi:L-seryl-tRNA(Ser) seleniumtransferase